MQKIIQCIHCGTAFTPKADERYCCNGCYYVAQLIKEQDLGQFYELKGDSVIPPIGSKVFQSEDTEALETILMKLPYALHAYTKEFRQSTKLMNTFLLDIT